MELLRLPNLAWVALSENPFLNYLSGDVDVDGDGNVHANVNIDASTGVSELSLKVLPHDNLDDPTKGEILGKGASGITRKYTIPNPDNKNEEVVAVKEFYSNITSDGNPLIERRVSFTIATKIQDSKSLIKVLGQTRKGNLVMELLSDYEVLANPPSLQSCSRDVYDHYEMSSDSDSDSNSNSNKTMKSYVLENALSQGSF